MVELQRIKLKGFKSIREMDLELRDLNVLIGPNGSGKSNFVSLFTLVRHIAAGNLQTYVRKCGGAGKLLHFGRKTTDEITCELAFPSTLAEPGYYFWLVPTADDRLVPRADDRLVPRADDRLVPRADDRLMFAYEDADDGEGRDESSMGSPLQGGYPETRLIGRDDASRGSVPRRVRERLADLVVHHFHDTSESAKVKQTCDLDDNTFLRPDGANLASILYLLGQRYEREYRNIVDVVRMAAPFFDDFDLHPSELNERKIRLQWREKGSEEYFGPESLSDGTLRFICLATLLLQPKPPSLIIIDEPELGLHPHAIGVVAAMLKSASVKSQVIVCTQSVTLVNQLKPADVVVLEREDGPTTFRRLSGEDMSGWLDDYGLGDLWEKNILGGSP